MIVAKTVKELENSLASARENGQTVGLVPTMALFMQAMLHW